ncbi:MAG: hypothetical protein A2V93_09845 [Ignavibacteria bacterium RBG_16_34_14]|nr:MAG: hypothetical protein A2V93_09845 [Ignavibacteria bacterium RBG_16_34_14]
MKRLINFLLIVILICFFYSCAEEEIYSTFEDGVYEGTFTMVESNNTIHTGKVTFSFIHNKYICIPESQFLPPSGGGNFQISKNILTLEDKVAHTANFDWSLILNGKFNFTYDGKKLILKQNDRINNRYRTIDLIKQE